MDELLDEEIFVPAVEVIVEVEGGLGVGDDVKVALAVEAEPRVEEVAALEVEPRAPSLAGVLGMLARMDDVRRIVEMIWAAENG